MNDSFLLSEAQMHRIKSELVDLRWDKVDFGTATLHVRRVKQGTPSQALRRSCLSQLAAIANPIELRCAR